MIGAVTTCLVVLGLVCAWIVYTQAAQARSILQLAKNSVLLKAQLVELAQCTLVLADRADQVGRHLHMQYKASEALKDIKTFTE